MGISTGCQLESPLACRIELDESNRLTVYDDATGKPIVPGSRVIGNPTIGRGTLLCAPGGITEAESQLLFRNRVAVATRAAATLPAYAKLDPIRQGVLVEMVFQMGLGALAQFKNTLAAMEAGDWKAAAQGMRNSRWHSQTPARVDELARIIETGKNP